MFEIRVDQPNEMGIKHLYVQFVFFYHLFHRLKLQCLHPHVFKHMHLITFQHHHLHLESQQNLQQRKQHNNAVVALSETDEPFTLRDFN